MTQDDSGLQGVFDLTPKQQQFLIAMLESPSITEAAQVAGISRSTATRIMADDNFQDALRRAQDHALLAAMSSYQNSFATVRRVLQDLAEDTETPPTVRARSAAALGALTLRAAEYRNRKHETETLEDQLEELRLLVESGGTAEGTGGYGV